MNPAVAAATTGSGPGAQKELDTCCRPCEERPRPWPTSGVEGRGSGLVPPRPAPRIMVTGDSTSTHASLHGASLFAEVQQPPRLRQLRPEGLTAPGPDRPVTHAGPPRRSRPPALPRSLAPGRQAPAAAPRSTCTPSPPPPTSLTRPHFAAPDDAAGQGASARRLPLRWRWPASRTIVLLGIPGGRLVPYPCAFPAMGSTPQGNNRSAPDGLLNPWSPNCPDCPGGGA